MKKRAADLAESALCIVQWVDATAPCGIPTPFLTGVSMYFHVSTRLQTREMLVARDRTYRLAQKSRITNLSNMMFFQLQFEF